MKTKIINIFWGTVLILLGGLLLVERLGYFDVEMLSDNVWVIVFAIASAFFFLSYFLSGVRKWGWLFPALACAALALTIWMALNHVDGSFLGAPILAAVALPFYVGFVLDRSRWGLLIPAWIMSVLTLITLSADTVNGDLIGALFLFSAALPFLVVFLYNRSRRWALIPASILVVLGLLPLLDSIIGGDVMGAAVMFLFALPFFVVYFWSKNNWWALIPAGVFASIGLIVVISLFVPDNQEAFEGILTGILFLGFGVTFGVLWLRRAALPTDWAKYPAVGLFTAALVAFILGKNFQDFWAIALIAVGVMLILISLLPKRAAKPPKPEDQA